MNNLRVLSDNAIDRAATLQTSGDASVSMASTNLKNDRKSNVWRSALGTAASIKATWSSSESIGCVALPFCNLSPTAFMRVRTTNEVVATNLLSSPNSFVAGAWTLTGVTTATGGSVSPDGVTTSTVLTATANGGTMSQSAGSPLRIYASSIFIRRRTGTGAISIRNSNNTTWTPLSVTSSWARYTNVNSGSMSTPLFSLQLASSGDAIEICFAQLELTQMTSYYPGTRPLGYIDGWQSYDYDSGNVQCCPEPAAKLQGWTAAQAASAYAFGGGSFARVWIPSQTAVGLSIDISDVSNVQGYIEAARVVAGTYWSSTYNPSGVTFGIIDSATVSRSEAGDQLSEVGTIHRSIKIDMSMMPPQDKASFVNILRNSRVYPVLVSVFPESIDERDTAIYGRRTKDSDISISYGFAYNSTLEVESI